MTFPGATATIYRNEDGEVLGWDQSSYDEPPYVDDFHDDMGDQAPEFATEAECVAAGWHARDGEGTDVPGVYRCEYCPATYGTPEEPEPEPEEEEW